jgi:hypothetical protein
MLWPDKGSIKAPPLKIRFTLQPIAPATNHFSPSQHPEAILKSANGHLHSEFDRDNTQSPHRQATPGPGRATQNVVQPKPEVLPGAVFCGLRGVGGV